MTHIREHSFQHREQFLIDLAIAMEIQGNLSRSKSLKQLKHIEMIRKLFRKLRTHLDTQTLSSPISIDITTPEGTTSTIMDTKTMHDLIIHHNTLHFNQAQGSPPTTPPLSNILGDGLDDQSQLILDGKAQIPPTTPYLMTKFIENLKQTQHHNEPPIFPLEQIIQAFKNGMNLQQHHHPAYT